MAAPAPGTAPQITVQPLSQTVPLGSSATLSVHASGSTPFQYQWSRNGTPIDGATTSPYTTSTLGLADSGDQFTVTVTNSLGSVTSAPAVITIGPRSPDPRDLRFKHVDFPQPLTDLASTNIVASTGAYSSFFQPDTVGTPMEVGTVGDCAGTGSDANCSWHFNVFTPASTNGFYSFYSGDLLTDLQPDLKQVERMQNAVLTTLDEQPAYGLMAYSYEQDQTVSGGFTQTFMTVLPANFQQTAQQLGDKGGVITAATANEAGSVDLVSYTWAGAATTTYDVQALLVSAADVEEQASSLAADGYILTAVGSAGANQFVLVGTKVHGDTLPRSFYALSINNPGPSDADPELFEVGGVFDQNGNVVFVEE